MRTIATVLKMLFILTFLTGIIYPLVVTGIAHFLFTEKAAGSLVHYKNAVVGSQLIGQSFDNAIWFHPRPSELKYYLNPSGGSNLSATSKDLSFQIKLHRDLFIQKNMTDRVIDVPPEMIYSSASGLDPHISSISANLQVNRISKARNLDTLQTKELYLLINRFKEPRQFHLLGEERINVFMLNLALDQLNGYKR